MAEIEAWAAGLSVPAYATYDQTAIRVGGGTFEVVSEGHWRLFPAREGPLRPRVASVRMTP